MSYQRAVKKSALLIAIILPLQSCSYSYPVLAKMIGGRLAFVSGDDRYDCIASISVTAAGRRNFDPAIDNLQDPVAKGEAVERVRNAWRADAGQWVCKVHYPVFYGARMAEVPTLAGPRKLLVEEPYSVSVMGHGSSGNGCFRIRRTGFVENLPDGECSVVEQEPESPAFAAGTVYPVRARAAPASYFKPGDVPKSALPANGEARTTILLTVDKDGRATRCSIARSSGSPLLDSTTCRVMRDRAGFIAATAPNSLPTTSNIEQEVTWTPTGVKVPGPSGSLRAELDVYSLETNTVRTIKRFESMSLCRNELGRMAEKGPADGYESFCFEEPPASFRPSSS